MVAIAGGACRTAPIRNVPDTPLASAPGARLTLKEVSKAIWRAGRDLGWRIDEVRPGELTGTLKIRRHVAVVAIVHDTSTFRISYKDSANLLHAGEEIHKRYNTWVRNLETAIQREVGQLSSSR